MSSLNRLLLLPLILLFIVLGGCKKPVEVREKIVYVNPSDIKEYPFANDELIAYPPINFISLILIDSIISRQIDVNQDGQADIIGFSELFHIDTIFYVKSYLKKINSDIEILNQTLNNDLLLTCFLDEMSYNTPNPSLWNHNKSFQDEYLISTYGVIKRYDNGKPYYSFGMKINGSISLSEQRYFFGFRLKNKSSTQFDNHWNYGFVQMYSPGSGTSSMIERVAIENNVDQPILMKQKS